MIRYLRSLAIIVSIVVASALVGADRANAELWVGCVGVVNVSGVDATVRLDEYPGWTWRSLASDSQKPIYLKTTDAVAIVHWEHGSSAGPPIHIDPGNSLIFLYNFFTGEHDPDNNCTNAWRIVIAQPPPGCRPVDGHCS